MSAPAIERLMLPILNEDGDRSTLAPLITMAVMYFPSDHAKIDPFISAMSAGALRDGLETDHETRTAIVSSGVLKDQSFWRLLGSDRNSEDLLKAAEHAPSYGFTAANVLSVALAIRAQMPRLASVNNAVRIVMRIEDRSESEVKKRWGNFKPVAHLWAAALTFQSELADQPSLGWVSEDPEFLQDENLAEFLGVSEAYRKLGEAHKAIGARSALLPIGTPFCVPDGFEVPDAEVQFSQLEQWMISEIGAI